MTQAHQSPRNKLNNLDNQVRENQVRDQLQVLVNGEPRIVDQQTSLAQLLEQLSTSRYVAVELNGDVVPRKQHAHTVLHDGDQLELVTLVGGG